MRPSVTFFVAGIAKPAGSKRGFFIPKINRVVITDACKGSKDWKTDVKHEAQLRYEGELWDCPIHLTLIFTVTRPKGHFKSGKNSAFLKDNSPVWPTTRPDVLKLARAVEDALTGIIWKDDSQIVHEVLIKRYGDRPGVDINIRETE